MCHLQHVYSTRCVMYSKCHLNHMSCRNGWIYSHRVMLLQMSYHFLYFTVKLAEKLRLSKCICCNSSHFFPSYLQGSEYVVHPQSGLHFCVMLILRLHLKFGGSTVSMVNAKPWLTRHLMGFKKRRDSMCIKCILKFAPVLRVVRTR